MKKLVVMLVMSVIFFMVSGCENSDTTEVSNNNAEMNLYKENGDEKTEDEICTDNRIEENISFNDIDYTQDSLILDSEEETSIIVDSDEVSVNGNTEGNRHNGGWVAEQGDWNYYAISGCIYKENVVNGKKEAIFKAMSNNANISLQVMGEWIYFEIEDNVLYRISVDGSIGQKYMPDLGNDVIIDWDVYNSNVYIIVRENLSASTYNYYLAKIDWDANTYQRIFDIGDMNIDDDVIGEIGRFPEEYYLGKSSLDVYRYFHFLYTEYFLGIDDGYAYFVYIMPESDKFNSSFVAYRVNLDNIENRNEIFWENNKKLAYCSMYICDNCIYAFSYGNENTYDVFEDASPEDNYYDVIDFRDNSFSTYWVPELKYNMEKMQNNISTLGIVHCSGFDYRSNQPFIYISDDKVVEVSGDKAEKVCTAHGQIYYFCNDLYCRINWDGTGWESIDLNSFEWIDDTIVFE